MKAKERLEVLRLRTALAEAIKENELLKRRLSVALDKQILLLNQLIEKDKGG